MLSLSLLVRIILEGMVRDEDSGWSQCRLIYVIWNVGDNSSRKKVV